MRVVQARHGQFICDEKDRFVGRSLVAYGEYSEPEARLLVELARPGSLVVDAGANIGALTVPLARAVGLAGMVLAFEPQRLIYNMLCGNLALNQILNTLPLHAALGEAEGTTTVPCVPYGEVFNYGDVAIESATGEAVRVIALDDMRLDRLDLLKADVQGAEERILRGAAGLIDRFKPILYLENDRRETSPALISRILSFGYDAWWHLPAMYNPENFLRNPEDVFGAIVSANLLCAHPSRRIRPSRLPAVTGPDDWWKSD